MPAVEGYFPVVVVVVADVVAVVGEAAADAVDELTAPFAELGVELCAVGDFASFAFGAGEEHGVPFDQQEQVL